MTQATPRLRAALPPSTDAEPVRSRSAFEAQVAEVAPWFQADEATMDRLAGTWATMQDFAATLAEVRPRVEQLIEQGSTALRAVDDICAGIPGEVWDATDEFVDDWEVTLNLVGGEVTLDAMALGERLAGIDPPCPELRTSPAPSPTKPAAAAPPLPPETVTYLAEAGAPVAYPALAVRSRRDHESPPQAIHFVHWLAQGRRDIAGHGLPWAEGHLEGLRLASSLAGWPGELTEHAVDVNGRPDLLAASCAAWVRDENAAEALAVDVMTGMPSSISVALLIGPDAAEEATVHVHAGPGQGGPLGAVRFHLAGSYLSLQAGPSDGGPAALVDLLDSLAARLRDEHARWLALQPTDNPEGGPR